MERINVSEFKATCLRLLDRVRETGQPLEILKNGKPLAVVQPPAHTRNRAGFGAMKASLFTGPLGDVVTPAGDSHWEALRKK
ncbi:MAG: type II toxin-antitoxin system Phd/YefM family antitoxin [Acidobacteria bacterium]|nr:type II toxin-antitoxin system Phd/YefM family antitoxin [Acidobacteriota bacterium]